MEVLLMLNVKLMIYSHFLYLLEPNWRIILNPRVPLLLMSVGKSEKVHDAHVLVTPKKLNA